MMSSRTTNARRRAVERAVKQSQLARRAVAEHYEQRAMALRPSSFEVAEQAALAAERR